ncbi:MAG TPA: ABC transporter substrate-binding protein [Acetobacteraceae bacterium]|nr:ABC transporter substrate-binding protein [Acetobacteraceae bacterium]
MQRTLLGTFLATIVLAASASATETPKHGGSLTYMIPADAPPSLDGHRENTFVTVHATAPFYSVLIRLDPEHPEDTTHFVCDLCTEMPASDGMTYAFLIRRGVRWHDGSPLTAQDVAASWQHIIHPPAGYLSARANWYEMVDSITVTDPDTVVFRLKFATPTFLPALASPHAYIYKADIIAQDPHWYEKNVMGSGPFKFAGYDVGQSIRGERNRDYYRKGLPYLDGFVALFADKQSVRVEAIRADRAATEFRGLPPSTIEQLRKELGDKITVQESDWNCGNLVTPNSRRAPFDDVRVRRALLLAIDQWHGAPALSKIANVRTVGGIVFPATPMAATKEELQQLAGFWPDIDRSRAEAKRLLKESGHENLSFELLNRNIDQPYKYVGTWLVDEWSKIGVKATQKMAPTGPWLDALRTGSFDVAVEANCNGVVNPVMDTQKYLPHASYALNYGGYDDPVLIGTYEKLLHEPDAARQRALMRTFETRIVDTMAYEWPMLWWSRVLPARSYLHGWRIGPSHYVNQDLATIWLDR